MASSKAMRISRSNPRHLLPSQPIFTGSSRSQRCSAADS